MFCTSWVGLRYEKKEHFVEIVTSLVAVLLKMTLLLCIYIVFTKKLITLSLFNIDTLNFGICILMNLICP